MLSALGKHILPLLSALPLAGGRVHSQNKIPPRLISRFLYRLQNVLDGLLIACQVRGKSALVSHRRGQALFL